MIRSLARRLRAEDGSALMISFFILLAVLAFSAATFQASVILSNTTNRDTNSAKAFQAADSGIDTAVHRLAMLTPASGSCLTTAVVTCSVASSSWGPSTSAESVDSGSSFTYQVSNTAPAACVGTAASPSGASDRCIVAVGTANGVQRRIMVRVATLNGGVVTWPTNGQAQASDSVKVESNVAINSSLAVMNKLEVSHGSTITGGSVHVGPKARVKGLTTGSYTTDASVQLQDPVFDGTTTPYSVSNPNGNNNSSISSAYYSDTASSPRTLHIPGNKQVTLAPGVYNFCKIQIDGRGILNAGGTFAAPVKVYLDSPARTGSGCAKNQGTLAAGNKAGLVNPSQDPRAFAFIAWGTNTKKKRTRLQIPLAKAGTLAAIIVAPHSEVRFNDNKGLLVGDIQASRIVFKHNMRFYSGYTSGFTLNVQSQSFRVAWKQCTSTPSPTAPATGC